MLFDTEDENWIFKRDESIRRSLKSVTVTTSDGLNLLAPEIQVLYKPKSHRQKDQQDLQNALEATSKEQKAWLRDALTRFYKEGHAWLKQL